MLLFYLYHPFFYSFYHTIKVNKFLVTKTIVLLMITKFQKKIKKKLLIFVNYFFPKLVRKKPNGVRIGKGVGSIVDSATLKTKKDSVVNIKAIFFKKQNLRICSQNFKMRFNLCSTVNFFY